MSNIIRMPLKRPLSMLTDSHMLGKNFSLDFTLFSRRETQEDCSSLNMTGAIQRRQLETTGFASLAITSDPGI